MAIIKIEFLFSYCPGLGWEELKRYLCSKIHNFQVLSFFLSQQIDLLKEKKKFFALFTCNLLCLNNLFNSSVHFFSGMIYVYLRQFNSLTTTKNVLLYLLIVFEKYFCSNIANNTHLFQLKPSGFSCHVVFSSLSEDCMKLKNTVLLLSKQNFN